MRKPPQRRSAHREPKEYEEAVIQLDRVTRVVKGGRRLRFRATVVVGNKKGKVIIQTLKPENSVIKFASNQDSINFLKSELKLRSKIGYPPFTKLVNIKFTGKKDSETSHIANYTRSLASKILSKFPLDSIEILGPSQAPINKIKNKYRWQLLIKSRNQKDLHKFIRGLLKAIKITEFPSSIKISFDIDPISFS